jgi:putative flippase GtrA
MVIDAARSGTPAQFLRFLFVGALNTAFGYGVFAALVLSGMAPAPALVATYVVGILFNFFTTRRLVFGHAGSPSTFLRFVAAYGVIYLFNAALFELVGMAGIGPLLGQALCLPVVAVFSFLLFKLHVFRTIPGRLSDGDPR